MPRTGIIFLLARKFGLGVLCCWLIALPAEGIIGRWPKPATMPPMTLDSLTGRQDEIFEAVPGRSMGTMPRTVWSHRSQSPVGSSLTTSSGGQGSSTMPWIASYLNPLSADSAGSQGRYRGSAGRWRAYGSYVDEPIVMIDGPVGENRFSYYHANHLYSVAAITNSSGQVVERYNYSAYGQRSVEDSDRDDALIGNDFRFTGRRFDDETGLWYFRARYYDAGLGRFIERDPYGYTDQEILEHGIFPYAGLMYIDGYSAYLAYFVPNDRDPLGTEMWTCGCDDLDEKGNKTGGTTPKTYNTETECCNEVGGVYDVRARVTDDSGDTCCPVNLVNPGGTPKPYDLGVVHVNLVNAEINLYCDNKYGSSGESVGRSMLNSSLRVRMRL